MALPRQNRLRKKRDFDAVFKNRKVARGSFLFIKFRENNTRISRFGFVVSAKVAGKAVVRNRIRRVLSEAIRLNMNDTKQGYDIVVVIIKREEADKLRDDLLKILRAAKLII